MRIVAGAAGGIPLVPPPGPARPTMDRVREAVFSSLGDAVPGSRVLDLFAGCGSLGLEALSRGAASAVFVENAPSALAALRKNMEKTGLRGTVEPRDVLSWLSGFSQRAEPPQFDLVFADPPYAKRPGGRDFALELLGRTALASVIAPGGLLVLETSSAWKAPETAAWGFTRSRRYGGTAVHFLTARP